MLRILFGVSGQLRLRRTNKATKQSPSNSRQSDPLVGAALRASDDPERLCRSLRNRAFASGLRCLTTNLDAQAFHNDDAS